MTTTPVILEYRGAVAVITLNAPARRNVLSERMVVALTNAYDEIERGDSRCIVLTGAGGAFCAGAELDTLERAADGDFAPVQAVYQGFLRVLASPLPTIGAINGAAVGAGLNLALACDVRIVASTARFDTRFAALRLHPGGGHTGLLTRAVGAQRAMLGTLFGEVWDADAAVAHGLAAAAYPQGELVPAAIELGTRLGSLSSGWVRRVVDNLRRASVGASHSDLLARESIDQQWSLSQREFLDGLEEIRARIAIRKT